MRGHDQFFEQTKVERVDLERAIKYYYQEDDSFFDEYNKTLREFTLAQDDPEPPSSLTGSGQTQVSTPNPLSDLGITPTPGEAIHL